MNGGKFLIYCSINISCIFVYIIEFWAVSHCQHGPLTWVRGLFRRCLATWAGGVAVEPRWGNTWWAVTNGCLIRQMGRRGRAPIGRSSESGSVLSENKWIFWEEVESSCVSLPLPWLVYHSRSLSLSLLSFLVLRSLSFVGQVLPITVVVERWMDVDVDVKMWASRVCWIIIHCVLWSGLLCF